MNSRIPRLEGVQNGAPYLLATQTAALASVFMTLANAGLRARTLMKLS